jgi:signal transduction histidine kinase
MTTQIVKIELEKSQTLDAMLHQILNQALVTIGAEAGSLMLVANKQGILQIKARLGKPQPGRTTERVFRIDEKSIASWVVNHKQSRLCSDVTKDDLFSPPRDDQFPSFRSLLSVPIIYDDKVIALINADSDIKDYFTKENQKWLELIAKQVASPLAERIRNLEAIAKVPIELIRLPREGGVEAVLQKITQLAVSSLGADLVTLYPYIEEKDEFPVEHTGPITAGTIMDFRPMQSKVYPGDSPWTVIKERRSGFYADATRQQILTGLVDRPGEEPRPRFIEREGVKSVAFLLLPYRAAEDLEEEVVGVMFVNYRTRHEFSIDEISDLATFADYAAVAILNARLEERRQREQVAIVEAQRDAERREAQQRAEQLKLMEGIAANFAHRMNNLAGTGRVAAQVLREHVDPHDELALRQLDRIGREANLLLELARKLADTFRETGSIYDPTPIDITKVLEEEVAQIKVDLPNVTVIIDSNRNLPRVRSVEFQLRQVLRDIVSNAIEALQGQEFGKIVIRTWFNRKNSCVEVEIADNGPGIRDDLRDRLFAPGVTTKTDSLGIGLWWCRTFMRATGGNVTLNNTKIGEGSTFLIEIPCVNDSSEIGSTNVVLVARTEKDILIVDDEVKWHDQVKDSILTTKERYLTETATNYIEAIDALERSHFKVAIVDLSLVYEDPENTDGFRLLDDMDKANLDTKVIMVSGYWTEQTEREARENHRVLACIHREGFNVPEFREIIRRAIN